MLDGPEDVLGEKIVSQNALSGGDIHDTSVITTESGSKYVVKSSNQTGFFEAEADGLKELASAEAIRVPVVVAAEPNFLIIEYIEPVPKKSGFFSKFGSDLAKMHRKSAEQFGHHRDNFIGRLPQDNAKCSSLTDFFGEHRFLHLSRLGRDQGSVGAGLARSIEKLVARLGELFEPIQEPPALLHGDLWGGNYLSSKEGAVLIDPAVYYGPREADMAMTKLFGGFSPEFERGYEEEYPLPSGWRERVELFNIYHLLTHTIMFGGGYAAQAEGAIRKYL
ncbi:MAG: fructosamine kinase family protein [Candidatus Lindowbacteria bacterium]|nr:fructosamine kinase family protein [Candidatus Lindowbacteria bacterium]